jgi:hypothetical protein
MQRLLIAIGLLAASTGAGASCTCNCVAGQVLAVCTRVTDTKPVCAPTLCQPPAPSPDSDDADKTKKADNPPPVSPLRTQLCNERRVFNPQTGKYETRNVCH